MKLKIPFSFILFVVIPVVIASVYYTMYASGQYVVETKYIIESHEKQQASLLGSLSSLAGGAPSSTDAYIAQEYIWSAGLLDKVDKVLKVKEHYSDPQFDWWARLNKDASFLDLLEYWREKIEIQIDSATGITTLSVTAFTPEKALLISRTLLKEAEEHVNKLTQRSSSDQLHFAKKELDGAEKRLIEMRTKISVFRRLKKDINPAQTTIAKLNIVAELESKLSITEAELANMKSYLQPGSIKLRAAKKQVDSLKRQISIERQRWGNEKNSNNTLNTRIAEYEKLLAKKTIAEKFYESALGSLEAIRLSTLQQQQYLEVIVAPYKPNDPEKPNIRDEILSVFFGSFLLWVIGSLITSAIKDHV